MTQVELGRRLGISQAAVSQFERGLNLNPNKVGAIAKELGVKRRDVYACVQYREAEAARIKVELISEVAVPPTCE